MIRKSSCAVIQAEPWVSSHSSLLNVLPLPMLTLSSHWILEQKGALRSFLSAYDILSERNSNKRILGSWLNYV